MENLKFTNLLVFALFFGIALIEAAQKGNWRSSAFSNPWNFVFLGRFSENQYAG